MGYIDKEKLLFKAVRNLGSKLSAVLIFDEIEKAPVEDVAPIKRGSG